MRSRLAAYSLRASPTDTRIGRIVGDALGAGNHHTCLTAFRQNGEHARRNIRGTRRDQAEMTLSTGSPHRTRASTSIASAATNICTCQPCGSHNYAPALTAPMTTSAELEPELAIFTRVLRQHGDVAHILELRDGVQHAGIVGPVEARLHQHCPLWRKWYLIYRPQPRNG
jgi:hypothetical protein